MESFTEREIRLAFEHYNAPKKFGYSARTTTGGSSVREQILKIALREWYLEQTQIDLNTVTDSTHHDRAVQIAISKLNEWRALNGSEPDTETPISSTFKPLPYDQRVIRVTVSHESENGEITDEEDITETEGLTPHPVMYSDKVEFDVFVYGSTV
jgi:hypothetical protein